MDYGRLVSRAFEIAWQHKWLWIFGMFAAGTGFNFKIEYILGLPTTSSFDFQQPPSFDLDSIMMLYAGLIPIMIIFGLVMILAKGAIIDSVNRIERGGTFSFSSAFSAGIDYFLRFLGLAIIFIVVWIAYVFIAVLIIGISAAIIGPFAILIGFIGILISLIFLVSIVQIMNLAQRVVVIRNVNIMDALGEGYQLFKTYLGANLAAFFIILAFAIIVGISTFIFWIMINFPIDSLIQALGFKSFLALFTALVIGLPISYIFGGIFGVFTESFMTLFYIELVEPKQQPLPENTPPLV